MKSARVSAQIAAFLGAVFYCAMLWAGPASWYQWRSPFNESAICSQISPGESWEPIKGPFQDASCRKLGVPH
jgi:hypothetical protein